MNFDPYLEWLKIPAGSRPPDHYTLLGLPRFERDSKLIHQAVLERTEWIRKFSLGPDSATAIQLLDELSQAFSCLSDPDRQKEYNLRPWDQAADTDELRGLAFATPLLEPVSSSTVFPLIPLYIFSRR